MNPQHDKKQWPRRRKSGTVQSQMRDVQEMTDRENEKPGSPGFYYAWLGGPHNEEGESSVASPARVLWFLPCVPEYGLADRNHQFRLEGQLLISGRKPSLTRGISKFHIKMKFHIFLFGQMLLFFLNLDIRVLCRASRTQCRTLSLYHAPGSLTHFLAIKGCKKG